MFAKDLFCLCGARYSIGADLFLCPHCKRSLEVGYDYKAIKRRMTKKAIAKRPLNHMRYRELFPVRRPVSIQEGGTPMLKSKNIGPDLGIDLWFKLENLNPTGSFKDRGSSIEVSKALEYGARNVVCASTGNMGASVASYSAVAGIKCHIFVPKAANHVKIEQILSYGAKVSHIQAGYNSVEAVVEKIGSRKDFYLLGDYLWRREGTKSVGYEIMEQSSPDWIFTPVGNGTLASATWKAIQEFNRLGLARKRPRMAAIQAKGCSPLVTAWETNHPLSRHERAETVAHAIECEIPIDGERAMAALKQSKGFADAATDKEILHAREILASNEGIFAEPSGAASLAGLIKNHKKVRGRVVCIVTGHGLKTPFTGIKAKPIETSIKKLEKEFNLFRD